MDIKMILALMFVGVMTLFVSSPATAGVEMAGDQAGLMHPGAALPSLADATVVVVVEADLDDFKDQMDDMEDMLDMD